MATATTPSEIDVRWELANYGRPTRYSKSGEISLTFTRRHERVDAALGEIAAMLVQDGVWPEERQEGDDSLEELTGTTWEMIEKLFKAWAGRAHERRDLVIAQRAAKRAEKVGSPAV